MFSAVAGEGCPRSRTAERNVDLRRRASEPPSRLDGNSRSRVRPARCHEGQVDVQSGRICHMTTARPPPDGSNRHRASPKKVRGFPPCAREDSNLHGPISPQGPQPESSGVDGFSGVRGSPNRRVSCTDGTLWIQWMLSRVLSRTAASSDNRQGGSAVSSAAPVHRSGAGNLRSYQEISSLSDN